MTDDSQIIVENTGQTPIEYKHEPEVHKPALSDLRWTYKAIIIVSLLTLSGKDVLHGKQNEVLRAFQLIDPQI
jgi:hypothetical protein